MVEKKLLCDDFDMWLWKYLHTEIIDVT